MSIELYVFPPSPRAFKVMAVANHLGLDWTPRNIDLPKGEQKTPQYEALNPNMRMPTLKDGDYVLWESNAILQYLAAKKPESGLLPRDERGAARRHALAVLGSRALGSDLRHLRLRIRGQAVRAARRRARHGGDRQGHRGVPSRRQGAGRPAQGQANSSPATR